jgi:hypothetical protein
MHHNGTKQKAETSMNTHTGNVFLRQLYLLLIITEILSLLVKNVSSVLRKNKKKYSEHSLVIQLCGTKTMVKYNKRCQDIWQYMDRDRERDEICIYEYRPIGDINMDE